MFFGLSNKKINLFERDTSKPLFRYTDETKKISDGGKFNDSEGKFKDIGILI
jgi:hypothetical protein